MSSTDAPSGRNILLFPLLALLFASARRAIGTFVTPLATSDETVNATFIALEDSITEKLSEELQNNGVTCQNIQEKVHLAMNIVQSFAHESVFDKHPYIDYSAMKQTVCQCIVKLFEN